VRLYYRVRRNWTRMRRKNWGSWRRWRRATTRRKVSQRKPFAIFLCIWFLTDLLMINCSNYFVVCCFLLDMEPLKSALKVIVNFYLVIFSNLRIFRLFLFPFFLILISLLSWFIYSLSLLSFIICFLFNLLLHSIRIV